MARRFITEEQIKDIIKSGGKTVNIPKSAIVSPLAMDLIKEKKLKIIYKKTKSGNRNYNLKDFPKELILSFYEIMLKIRLFEELAELYKINGIIPGDFVHCYTGQEAIATGVCSCLTAGDYITSTHRGHGHLIAKGADISGMLAELLGKADGLCHGKGGSMHVTDIDTGILGANGIVGAGLPIACGSGLASKMGNDRAVTVSFFGDGATNQGTFGESLNFARVFNLPVMFVCENNGYAVSTPASNDQNSPGITKRAEGYGIISEKVNGNDVFEVYSVCKKHVDEMIKSPYPVLIEAVTARHSGHWVGDPQKYRPETDFSFNAASDPIKLYLDNVKDYRDIQNTDLKNIENTVVKEIKSTAKFAHESSYPAVEEAVKDFLKE